jgi:hypothetical protein
MVFASYFDHTSTDLIQSKCELQTRGSLYSVIAHLLADIFTYLHIIHLISKNQRKSFLSAFIMLGEEYLLLIGQKNLFHVYLV